jgi:hypothetical protein
MKGMKKLKGSVFFCYLRDEVFIIIYRSGWIYMKDKAFNKNFASALFLLLFLHISSVSASERMARIIGGEPADSSAWPWMAGLVYKRSISTNEVFCGASLIAKDWVLTAAHCVDDVGSASFDVMGYRRSGQEVEPQPKAMPGFPVLS